MKPWLCWLVLVVGIVFLLGSPRRLVSPPPYPQTAGNPAMLHHNEFVSTCCRALQAASLVFTRNRAGPLEFFEARFGFLITDDNGPLWLDYRGPPGPNPRSQLWLLVVRLLARSAAQAGPSPEIPALQPTKTKNGVMHQPLASDCKVGIGDDLR